MLRVNMDAEQDLSLLNKYITSNTLLPEQKDILIRRLPLLTQAQKVTLAAT